MSEKPLRASTRIVLTRDLETLHQNFLKVVNDTYQVVKLSLAISSVKQGSSFLEEKIKTFSETIKSEIIQLENLALKILSLQQPLLRDLRYVIGVLKISENFSYLNRYTLEFISLYSSNLSSDQSETEEKEEEILDQITQINENLISYLQYFLEAIKSESVELIKELSEKIKSKDDAYNTVLKRAAETKSFEKSFYLLELIRLQERIKDLVLVIIKETYFIYQGEHLEGV